MCVGFFYAIIYNIYDQTMVTTPEGKTITLNEVTYFLSKCTQEQMKEVLLSILKWFKKMGLANPFNYNYGFEFIQCLTLGYKQTTVGGGSDGIREDGQTTELKAAEDKGYTKKGKLKSHSVSYNGTTKKSTIEEQKKYCYNKIMRDKFHHWTIFDYENGKLVMTLKIKNEDIWTLIWPKWEKAFYESSTRADGRINGSLSTNELDRNNIQYEVISH